MHLDRNSRFLVVGTIKLPIGVFSNSRLCILSWSVKGFLKAGFFESKVTCPQFFPTPIQDANPFVSDHPNSGPVPLAASSATRANTIR